MPLDPLPSHASNHVCLVAVSGGSDSMALLHLLVEAKTANLHAATVNHGLRTEAAQEAEFVANVCRELNVPHATLNWKPNKRDAQSARRARYELLAGHARSLSASEIYLGHTLDDQAETLVMRAQRFTLGSETRGLSGMTPVSSYADTKLLRPLLHRSRRSLRDYLNTQNQSWIEDPSNEKLSSERVRTRKKLASSGELPSAQSIAQLAHCAARTRGWLNTHVAMAIEHQVTWQDGVLHFKPSAPLPSTVVREVVATLIWAAGGLPYRPAREKIDDLVEALGSGKPVRKAVGRCLITLSKSGAKFSREQRNLAPLPPPDKQAQIFDNRIRIMPDGTQKPFITAMEYFRPSCDEQVYEALMKVLNSPLRTASRLI